MRCPINWTPKRCGHWGSKDNRGGPYGPPLLSWGAGGLWPPGLNGVQGLCPCYPPRASAPMASWLGACAKQLAARGVADAHAAARGGTARRGASGKRRAAPRRSPRPGSAGRVLPSEGRGGATPAAASTGATCRGLPQGAEEVRAPTIIRGRAHDEHQRGDRARSQQTAQGCPAGAPPEAAAALRRGMVRATAGARPAAAVAAVWKEGGACADPRATEAKRPKGAEQARRPAARVGRVGPQGPRGAGGCL